MKAYIERLQQEKTPHERRRFATQLAGVITAVLFVIWISTLGIRFATQNTQTANNTQNTANGLYAVEAASSAAQGQ